MSKIGPQGLALALFLALVAVAPRAGHARILVRTAVNYRPHPVARAAVVARRRSPRRWRWGPSRDSLPPSCSTVMMGNVAYQQCGSTWYQPRYAGSGVTYVVVNPPR